MSVETQTKSAVSVAEMARMVGLSRARFYQLQKAGVFPLPVYSVSTRRPIYVEEAQKVCLEVRRRNLGINGVPVLFYARRNGSVPAITKKAPPRKSAAHADLLDGLRALGLRGCPERKPNDNKGLRLLAQFTKRKHCGKHRKKRDFTLGKLDTTRVYDSCSFP